MTSVEDTGLGISEEAQLSLFQMFWNLQIEGKLNIAAFMVIIPYIYYDDIYLYMYRGWFWTDAFQKLTEAMRGSIHIKSKVKIDCKFTFSMPLYQQDIRKDDYSNEIILKSEMTIPKELINVIGIYCLLFYK